MANFAYTNKFFKPTVMVIYLLRHICLFLEFGYIDNYK